MRIKEVKYQRVKNLGNYETERLELLAELNEGEDHREAIEELKVEVEFGLNFDAEFDDYE